METKCIKIEGVLEVPGNANLDDVVGILIEFVESKGWMLGCLFKEMSGCEDDE